MSIFQPTDISGTFAWYKAHSISMSASGNVTFWEDSSGSGNHLVFVFPSSNTTCPVFVPNILNGYPIVRFDGTNDHLAATGNYFSRLPPSSLTSFLVYKTNNPLVEQVVFANDNDDGGSPGNGARNNFIIGINNSNNRSGVFFSWGKENQPAVWTFSSTGVRNDTSWYLRSDRWRLDNNIFTWSFNGVDRNTGVTSMSQSINNRLRVGCTVSQSVPTNFFNGDLAEVVAYSRRLNESEVSQVHQYLIDKYNLFNASATTLFMWSTENSGLYKTMPAYLDASNDFTNSIPLYISSFLLNGSGIDLFIPGSVESKSMPLYLESMGEYISGISLYTGSSDVLTSGFNIYISGYPSVHVSDIPFYIGSAENFGSGINFYTNSATLSPSSIPLYTNYAVIHQTGTTLLIPGQLNYINSTLFIHGYNVESSGKSLFISANSSTPNVVDLYINGKLDLGVTLPLFVKQIPAPTSTISSPLFIYASTPGSSGLYNFSPLYMHADGTSQFLPLFVGNTSNDYPSSGVYMPLFIKSPEEYSINGSLIDLILYNNASITGRMMKMYIRGNGVMDGASIYQENMNLFLKQNQGIDQGINMFINAGIPVNTGLPIYAQGVYNYTSSTDLVIYNDGLSAGQNLYIQGAYFSNSGIGLTTQGKDVPDKNIVLYINGY